MAYSDRASKDRDLFLKKLFSRGNYFEQLFQKLCDRGCSPNKLGSLLFAVCTIAAFAPRKSLTDLPAISDSEVKQLPRRLRSVADLVERMNRTGLAPADEIMAALPRSGKSAPNMPTIMTRLYRMLPGIMLVYAAHLERFSKSSRRLLKRLTLTHLNTLTLLEYVKKSTGKPQYEPISSLLEEGFVAAGGSEDAIPRLFSAAALAKQNQRAARLRPSRNRSAGPSSGQ
jgi:hypothetical protein